MIKSKRTSVVLRNRDDKNLLFVDENSDVLRKVNFFAKLYVERIASDVYESWIKVSLFNFVFVRGVQNF